MSSRFVVTEPVPFIFRNDHIERYGRNGIVVARLDGFIDETDTACRIFTEPLLSYERPAYAWIRQTGTMPKVVIASGRFGLESENVRESALRLDTGRELLYLDLSWSIHHPRILYFEPELTPTYLERTNSCI